MIKVLIAGEGGQGIQAIAEILAKAAFLEGKKSSYIPNFGVEQRGGVSLAFVVIDEKPVVYPKFAKADILAILSDRSWGRIKDYVDKETKIIFGPAVTEKNLPKVSTVLHLRGVNLPTKAWNILVLGKINKVGKIVSETNLIKALEERFAKQFEKNPELRNLDIEALKKVST
jgi:2-oxoglutarate ferredoxin oxidoreductase subunit gamma